MGIKAIHRWLGLLAGMLALVLALTGLLLALDPVQQAWQASATQADLDLATLAERVAARTPGVEQIRRLPSGVLLVYSFDGEQAQANRIDPQDGHVLGPYQPSAVPRWVKNLHRSLLLGDAGRWGAAATALAMLVLSLSGLVLLLRRMGGWRQLAGRVRGTLAQRLHVLAGRVALPVLLLSSVTALYMSATTLGLVELDHATEPYVVSVADGTAGRVPTALPVLQETRLGTLHKLDFPAVDDPEDTWELITDQGTGWIDRYTGQLLAWQDATAAQRIYDWVLLLHAGEGAWLWALVLTLAAASVPLFWLTGVILWRQGRCARPRITNNSALAQADMLIFVTSEGGSTWGFARALHAALVQAGHAVHTAPLEQFQTGRKTGQVFILAATHGDGDAPAHARGGLARIAAQPVAGVPVTVLGFGDRQFPAYCAFAEALERQLRAQGWPQLLPLESIHQQSAQAFALWGQTLAAALDEPLTLEYRSRLPATSALQLLTREDFAGDAGSPAVILRFALPLPSWRERLRGRGLGQFVAGDLVGILAPDTAVPRFYSLASGRRDGFIEICVRKQPGGICSGFLHALQPGDSVQAFIRPNPGFTLGRQRQAVLLMGAGTGVAPLAGFIRGNHARIPMHLYFGARNPAQDFYFGKQISQWLDDGRLTSLHTAFSRVPEGGGYVQDAVQRDAAQLGMLLAAGAQVRICGSRPMAQAVALVLDSILAPLGSSVAQLKTEGRYAEDVF